MSLNALISLQALLLNLTGAVAYYVLTLERLQTEVLKHGIYESILNSNESCSSFCDHYQDLLQISENVGKETKLLPTDKPINFDELVDPFNCDGNRCVITLSNFRNLDMHSNQNYPMLLRRPVPGVHLSNCGEQYFGSPSKLEEIIDKSCLRATYLWMMERKVHFQPESQHCYGYLSNHSSLLFHKEYPSWNHHCPHFHIDLRRLSVKSKPWNCILDVFVLPVVSLLNWRFEFPKPFIFEGAHVATPSVFPAIANPNIQLFVLTENLSSSGQHETMSKLMAKKFSDCMLDKPSNEVYFVATFDTNLNIHSLQLIQITQECFNRNKLNPLNCNWLEISKVEIQSLQAFTSILGSRSVTSEPEGEHSFQDAVNVFGSVDPYYSKVWNAIMTNFSYVYAEHGAIACEDFKEFGYLRLYVRVDRLNGKPNINYFPVLIRNTLQTFKFVTCGTKTKAPIAIYEILRAHDTSVWLGIVLSTVAVSLTINFFQSNRLRNLPGVIISIFQILFEKDYPFKKKERREGIQFKILIGIFLLMSIILSNAYKNSNVYKMISPRRPVPYANLSDLINAGFQILSRSAHSEYNYARGVNFDKVRWFHFGHMFQITGEKEYMMIVVSEVRAVMALVGLYGALHDSQSISSNMTGILERNVSNEEALSIQAFLKSKLHPDVITAVRSTAEIAERLYHLVFYRDRKNIQQKLNNIYMEFEEKILWREFSSCNKSALLLPVKLGHNYAKRLALQNSQVSVGKESYFESNVGFFVTGFVPPMILSRVWFLKASGVWERFDKITREMLSTSVYTGVTIPKTPNMTGNIVIIFFLLGAGLSFAFLCFLLEVQRH